METGTTKRLSSLDILRGLTIAGMIMVNNPGSWDYIFAPLRHAEWIGLTPTDLVFPFFMFIMGVSTCFSLKKFDYTLSKNLLRKIVKRTVLLYLIGVAISLVTMLAFSGTIHWNEVRLSGVLARLAICYGVVSLLASTVSHRSFPWIIVGLLVVYYIILLLGNGFVQGPENILSKVDCLMLGSHMYNDHQIDPEGVLSTIPSVAHVMLGFCCGKIFLRKTTVEQKVLHLLLWGVVGIFTGYLLSYGCPISKKIWSPSFVLVTCGGAAALLGLLIWLVDVKGCRRGILSFQIIGVNPLFCYVLGDLLFVLFNMSFPGIPNGLQHLLMNDVFNKALGKGEWASLAYALLLTGIVWGIAAILYKKKIYIKL